MVFCLHMCVSTIVYAVSSEARRRRALDILGGVIGVCQLPCGFRKLILCPLEKHPAL